MTNQDYRMLVGALAHARLECQINKAMVAGCDLAIDAIARDLATQNARFDRDKFITACGALEA